jgi:dTMP kinase
LRRYLAGPRRDLPPAKELALFLADRREHVAQVIEPALAAGAVVISDRYYFSSVAYQGALDLDPARILAENEAFAPRPDLVFLLTLPLDLARARGRQKPEDPRQLTEDPVYLEKVAALYDTLSGPNLHRVEAAGPPVEVHARLLDLTLQFLKKGS